MAIGLTDIDIDDIKLEIGASTSDFPELCESTLRNKWAIHRSYGNGSTAESRYTNMTNDPYLLYWKGYDQTKDPPGIPTLLNTVSDDGGTQQFEIRSYGNYVLERWELRDGDFGYTWYQIDNDDPSWFRVNEVSSNHTVQVDSTGNTVTGGTLSSSQHEANATLQLVVDSNLGDEREGRIILDHPDKNDNDAYANQRDFTQEEHIASGSISVSPTSINAPAGGGTYYLTVTAGGSWTSTAINDRNFFIWSPKTGDTGETTVTVPIAENITGLQRSASITFSTSTNDATVDIIQQG
ncbi:MAG: BACON domain-containing protein [Thiohalospira sp.]